MPANHHRHPETPDYSRLAPTASWNDFCGMVEVADVRTKTIRAALSLPSVQETLEMMQEAFGAYRAVIVDLSDAKRSAAWGDVSECLRQFETDGAFATEFEFVIGSGSKIR